MLEFMGLVRLLKVDIYLESQREAILSQPQVDPLRDNILVERVLRLLGALLMMDLHLYRSGYLLQTEDGGHKLNPTLSDRYLSFTAQVTRMLSELGMSPVSSKRFHDKGENLDVILRKVAEGK